MNPRRRKYFKKKILIYILLLGILGGSAFFLNIYFISSKPLFISPVGKASIPLESIEKILKKNKILFSEVIPEDNAYLVNIINNGQVRLDKKKEIDKQIASLQRILIQLTIEGKSFRNIDFRFEEPIISF